MNQIYVLVQIHPHGGDGFTIIAAFADYEAAHAEARIWGADTCRVLATDLRK